MSKWQIVQIQIRWLLEKPSDLDLHCLQKQGCPGSRGLGLTRGIRVFSKRKEFVLLGIEFLPFRVDPFSEGNSGTGRQTGSHK